MTDNRWTRHLDTSYLSQPILESAVEKHDRRGNRRGGKSDPDSYLLLLLLSILELHKCSAEYIANTLFAFRRTLVLENQIGAVPTIQFIFKMYMYC